jgi:hypothetical protein
VRAVVGVDVDRATLPSTCLSYSVNASKVITSALKRVDSAVNGAPAPSNPCVLLPSSMASVMTDRCARGCCAVVVTEALGGVTVGGDRLYDASLRGVGIAPCHDACMLPLACGDDTMRDLGVCPSDIGSPPNHPTVEQAQLFVNDIILRDFENQDFGTFSIGLDHGGVVIHQYGLPNEHTHLAPRNMLISSGSPQLGIPGMSSHSAVLLAADCAFCSELGGSRKFIIFGGQRGDLAASNEIIVFMPEDNMYTFMEAPNGTHGSPPARSSHTAVIRGSTMYIFGGRLNTGELGGDTWPIDFSAAPASWAAPIAAGADGPAGRRSHTAVVRDDLMLVFAGVDATGLYLRDLWALNLTARSWQQLDDSVADCAGNGVSPGARQRHSATLMSGIMYIFGGLDATGQYLSDLWKFEEGCWSPLLPSNSPAARGEHIAVAWPTPNAGDVLTVIGGLGSQGRLNDVHVYDPSHNRWARQLTVNASAHSSSAGIVMDNRIYIVGGYVSTDPTTDASRTSDIYVHNADVAVEAPTLLSANSSSVSLELSWSVPAQYTTTSPTVTLCGSLQPITLFELEMFTNGSTLLYRGADTKFTVLGLSPGTNYDFRLRGGSALGELCASCTLQPQRGCIAFVPECRS